MIFFQTAPPRFFPNTIHTPPADGHTCPVSLRRRLSFTSRSPRHPSSARKVWKSLPALHRLPPSHTLLPDRRPKTCPGEYMRRPHLPENPSPADSLCRPLWSALPHKIPQFLLSPSQI